MAIVALDATDARVVYAKVAGPAALLIAKLHKISERKGTARANVKDALDVFRLLRGVPTADFAARYRRVLADERSHEAAERGRVLVADLLHRGGAASTMAAAAATGFIDPDEVRLSCELLSQDLVAALARP